MLFLLENHKDVTFVFHDELCKGFVTANIAEVADNFSILAGSTLGNL